MTEMSRGFLRRFAPLHDVVGDLPTTTFATEPSFALFWKLFVNLLEEKYKDHNLTGNYVGYRECYVRPNCLLVYKKCKEEFVLLLYRTGSHVDSF